MGYFSKKLADLKGTSSFLYTGINAEELSKRVNSLFGSNGYKIKSENGNLIVYEKGRYGLRLLLGAFYTYFKFKVAVTKIDETLCQVTIIKASCGMSAGTIGTDQAKAEFSRIKTLLSSF